MSIDLKKLNRREAMKSLGGALAYTAAGATTIGPTMGKYLRDDWLETQMKIMRQDPRGLPQGLDEAQTRQGLEELFNTHMRPWNKRLTTALGAMIGYVSHSEIETSHKNEPDFY